MRVRRQILVWMAIASLAGIVLVAVGAALVIRSAVRDRSIERVRAEASLIARNVADARPPVDPHPFAKEVAGILGVRVTLIDAEGIVLGDSSRDDESLRRMDNHIDRPEVRMAREQGTGQSERLSDTVNVSYFYVATLVDRPGAVRYVRLALPASEVRRSQIGYIWIVVGVVLVSTVLTTALGYFGVRRISRPVEEIADAVERSVAGDLGLALPYHGGKEIGRLATAVKTMRRTLVEKIAELDGERTLLASVVRGMREGLMLVDADRQVRLANAAARDIFEIRVDPSGRPLTESIREPTVIERIETALDEGVPTGELAVRMPGSERSFQLQVTPLTPPDGGAVREVLVLLFDITRLERLESVRRDFVANVSHELRTPLTSIKAFVETLLDGGLSDEQNARRFLDIIRKHTDRMGELIEDLTDLSLIETGAVTLDLRVVDVADVVRGVVERLQPIAARRGVEVDIDLPPGLTLRADRRRLEQMMTNLVDNAVKFSDADGEVRVRGTTGAGGTVVRVEDDGVGIPTESRDKIFNRFYQEDKARSREVGGTGLGLAIVKHLMRLHGGRVRVESELGRGSRFLLEFPPEAADEATDDRIRGIS